MDTSTRIDEIADQFERAWESGPPRMEDFLQAVPEDLRRRTFDALLDIECHKQRKVGRQPPWDEYLVRFPSFAAIVEYARAQFMESHAGAGSALRPEECLSFADFELGEVLGTGGMGRVYRAFQRSLQRNVAIKLLRDVGDEKAVARFVREARTCARLRHPNIVSVHGIGVVPPEGCFIAMELISGHDLQKEIERGKLSVERAVSIACTLARAVDYAHSESVVHRDLKPANVLCAIDGTIKIVDFGVAKVVAEGHEPLTTSFRPIGTLPYMAPEQIDRKRGPVGPSTDIYGLGCVLYAMLSSHPPYSGDNVSEIFQRILSDLPAEPIGTYRDDVPFELESICFRCLRKKPQDRFAAAVEVADALRQVVGPANRGAELPAPPSEGLTLAEEIMLLALDDHSGNPVPVDTGDGCLAIAIAAGNVAELLLRGRIALREGGIRILSKHPTGNRPLDMFLSELIDLSDKSIAKALDLLGYRDRICQALVSRGILSETTVTRFFFFTSTLYPVRNYAPKMRLVQRLVEALSLPPQQITWRIRALVGILESAWHGSLLVPLGYSSSIRASLGESLNFHDESLAALCRAVSEEANAYESIRMQSPITAS